MISQKLPRILAVLALVRGDARDQHHHLGRHRDRGACRRLLHLEPRAQSGHQRRRRPAIADPGRRLPGVRGSHRHRRRLRSGDEGGRAALPVGVRTDRRRGRRQRRRSARSTRCRTTTARRSTSPTPSSTTAAAAAATTAGRCPRRRPRPTRCRRCGSWKRSGTLSATQPINISSGFRSIPCNRSVGGASNSEHLYGRSADLTGSHSFCTLAKQARYHGFGGIFGPGYPDHNDHTHVDIRTSNSWSAPNCGI